MKKKKKFKISRQCPFNYFLSVDSHGDVEEDGEEELVVDGHRYEAALVELGGRLPHLDAQADTPQQEQELHCNKVTVKNK